MSRLPAHHQGFNPLKETEKFTVQSSDVLDTLRIDIRAEGSEEVIWFKERYLLGDEIVENLVDNKTLRPTITVRRPARGGWYIHIHPSNANPQRSYINLIPPPQTSLYFDEAALSFVCRTKSRPGPWSAVPLAGPTPSQPPPKRLSSSQNVSPTTTHNVDNDSISSEATVVHSYPPTPPVNPPPMNPPSPNTVRAKLDQLSPSSPPPNSRRSSTTTLTTPIPSELTTFILAPHSSPHVAKPASAGLFSRALATILNHKPSHAASFTICPLPANGTGSVPSNSAASSGPSDRQSHRLSRSIAECVPHAPPALVTYHDQTPVWTFGSSTGLLEIDKGMETDLGLERGFVLAVALAYMEYLTERESYIAAAHG